MNRLCPGCVQRAPGDMSVSITSDLYLPTCCLGERSDLKCVGCTIHHDLEDLSGIFLERVLGLHLWLVKYNISYQDISEAQKDFTVRAAAI